MKKKYECDRCHQVIESSVYPETGEEMFCKCQCTLDADFNEKLWREINGKEVFEER